MEVNVEEFNDEKFFKFLGDVEQGELENVKDVLQGINQFPVKVSIQGRMMRFRSKREVFFFIQGIDLSHDICED